MRTNIRLVLAFILLSCGISFAPANAAEVAVRDRARDFAGWDMVNQRSFSSSEYAGRWTYVFFTATWCGPCMEEYPTLLPEMKRLRDAGRLEIVQVSLDTPETLPALRKEIRKYDIDFPVIYEGRDFDSVVVSEWGVAGIPQGYLISPEWVIMAGCRDAEELEPLLDYYQSPGYTHFNVSCLNTEPQDGTFKIKVIANSLNHSPVRVKLHLDGLSYSTDTGQLGGLVNGVKHDFNPDYSQQELLDLDEFGYAECEFTVTSQPEWDQVNYSISVVPLQKTEGLNIWQGDSCEGTVMLSHFEKANEYTSTMVSRWNELPPPPLEAAQ